MSRTRNLLVPLIFFDLLCVVPIASTVMSQDKDQEFWQFVQTVRDILAGNNVEQTQTIIARGASLVHGVRLEKLKAVVAGEITGLTLADTAYHGIMIQAKTNPSEDAGYLILKTATCDTTKVRFHTIIFMKDSTGKYKINSWHSGDCIQ